MPTFRFYVSAFAVTLVFLLTFFTSGILQVCRSLRPWLFLMKWDWLGAHFAIVREWIRLHPAGRLCHLKHVCHHCWEDRFNVNVFLCADFHKAPAFLSSILRAHVICDHLVRLINFVPNKDNHNILITVIFNLLAPWLTSDKRVTIAYIIH